MLSSVYHPPVERFQVTLGTPARFLTAAHKCNPKSLSQPHPRDACCALYTIRLDVANFNPNKAHRRLMRRWQRYLAGERTAFLSGDISPFERYLRRAATPLAIWDVFCESEDPLLLPEWR